MGSRERVKLRRLGRRTLRSRPNTNRASTLPLPQPQPRVSSNSNIINNNSNSNNITIRPTTKLNSRMRRSGIRFSGLLRRWPTPHSRLRLLRLLLPPLLNTIRLNPIPQRPRKEDPTRRTSTLATRRLLPSIPLSSKQGIGRFCALHHARWLIAL